MKRQGRKPGVRRLPCLVERKPHPRFLAGRIRRDTTAVAGRAPSIRKPPHTSAPKTAADEKIKATPRLHCLEQDCRGLSFIFELRYNGWGVRRYPAFSPRQERSPPCQRPISNVTRSAAAIFPAPHRACVSSARGRCTPPHTHRRSTARRAGNTGFGASHARHHGRYRGHSLPKSRR